MGTEAREAIPELLEALRGKDLRTQVQAAVTLIDLTPSVPGLLDKIRAIDRTGRWALPLARARLGAVRPEEVARLEKQLEDKDPQARLQAVLALARLAPRSPLAVKALTKALRHEDLQVRLAAAEILVDGRPDVREEALRVRQEVERALQAIEKANRARRRQAVHQVMRDPDVQARVHRFVALLVSYKSATDQGCKLPPRGLWKGGGFTAPGRRELARNSISLLSPLNRTLDATLDRLGPEAIPALVWGLNVSLLYPAGFC
jgi:HEAT repeat protein